MLLVTLATDARSTDIAAYFVSLATDPSAVLAAPFAITVAMLGLCSLLATCVAKAT